MPRQEKTVNRDYQFNTDKDLNEIWPEVIAEYERVTEKKLDPNTTFESFQQTVNERLREATSKRSSHARTILNNVGQCLEQFGSILANGASQVFAPSAQCWNAISFVIAAARKYSDVLDGFVTLMERCAAFLSRLNVFLKQECRKHGTYLPSHLRRPAYAILSHFINVLKSSYKLSTSKREKFKLVLEIVLFSGDAGVQSALDLLEQQVQDFTNVQIDQILLDVKGLARYLQESDEVRRQHHFEIREYMEHIYKVGEETLAITQQVKNTLDGRITQEKNREDLEKIRKAFNLKLNEEPWAKRHDRICKARIPDSGSWIENRDDLGFSAWADAHDHNNPARILTVEGDSGFGKTFISNKVISYLQDSYRSNNTSDRVTVAYYYYGENREDGENKVDSLERCIRCIIYQLATADPAYARAVADACQQSGGIARAEDIWDRLIVKLQHAMKGTYYICIDGFASTNEEEVITTIAQNVLSDIKGVSMRLYFSGTNEVVASIPQDDHGVRRILLGPVKDLGNKMVRLNSNEIQELSTLTPLINASDLEAIARARIEEMGKKKADLKTVMTEENIKKLVAGVHGHYEHLEAKMIQIDTCDTEQKIQDVIDSIGDDLKTSVRSSLKLFSESLTAEQIRQLNEIIVWVVGGKNISVEFLQSALYLAFNRNFMLRDLIATTFSGLLALDESGNVKLKSDQILQILREENQTHLKLSRSGASAVELTQAEIDLCSHIVKNVCGEYVYGKFNFDDFFNSLAGKQRASVQVDDENALNVVITRTLLTALCETNDEEHLYKLRRYACGNFYEHLQHFVEKLDYFEPDKESLREIGAKLSDVLYNPEAITDLWLKEKVLYTIRQDFFLSDSFIEPMVKFLRNPHAALGYAQEEEKNKWVQSAISAKANKYAILGRIGVCFARRWFTCKTMTAPEIFRISYCVFSKIKWGKYDPATPSLENVIEYLQWTQEQTGLDTTDPIWLSRVGATYRTLEHYEAALRAFKESESLVSDNWIVLLQIGETHAELKDFPAALKYLHKIKSMRSVLFGTDTFFKPIYWARVLLPEGNFHREIKNYDAAIGCYRDILDQDIEDAKVCHADALEALFAVWTETGDRGAIVAFLRGKKEEGKLAYWLGDIVGDRDYVHGYIVKAAQHANAVDEVSKWYDEIIEPPSTHLEPPSSPETEKHTEAQISKEISEYARENLRYFRTFLHFYASHLHHEHEKALSVWEKMVLKQLSNQDEYWVAYKARRLLARALLDKGASAPEPSTANSYQTRLEAICRYNERSIRDFRQSPNDPSLCLVRLHLLTGNQKLADEEARTLLRGVFDSWPEDRNDPSMSGRFAVLAQVLAIFNMDDDAVAAWQAPRPRAIEQTATEDSDQTGTESAADVPVRKTEAYLAGFVCDACEMIWKRVLVDCWSCKNCLCVQLCTPCHSKLLADELSELICCSSEHEFLYLPKVDEAQWSAVSDDSILVGGKLILREQWLNQFQERWNVQQEQIDAYKLETARKLKASLCIAKCLLKWKRKRQMKMKKARTFPLLKGQ